MILDAAVQHRDDQPRRQGKMLHRNKLPEQHVAGLIDLSGEEVRAALIGV
jgi:hypothetical protein